MVNVQKHNICTMYHRHKLLDLIYLLLSVKVSVLSLWHLSYLLIDLHGQK
jgi:hypothetical protein